MKHFTPIAMCLAASSLFACGVDCPTGYTCTRSVPSAPMTPTPAPREPIPAATGISTTGPLPDPAHAPTPTGISTTGPLPD